VELLTLPIVLVTGFITVVVLGLVAQRLLGLRLGTIRLIATGFFAVTVFPVITYALLGRLYPGELGPETSGTAGWFILLSGMCTILASMVFIVVIEAFVPFGSVPPPVVWGRGLRARFARTRRYWQIVTIGFRSGLGPYLRGRRERDLDSPGGRARLGRSLADTLNAGGVTFVKLGQLLATRRDLLHPEIADELARLQDDADPVPWDKVEAVLVDELGAPVDRLFAQFAREPLAAASVGQVHLARLHSGVEVAVKVQRPGIVPTVERDLDIAIRLAARLEQGTKWGRSIGASSLAEGLATAIREELDHRIEADNILAVARAQPGTATVVLPMPHRELSTERVLVMDRMVGTPLHSAAGEIAGHGYDPDLIARTLLDCLLRQIVLQGVFLADPHAGNVLLLAGGGLGLLDFGSVGRLDRSLREAMQRLLLGFDRQDPLAVSDALLELVPRPDEVDDQRLERDLGRFMARYTTGAMPARRQMFTDLFRIVAEHGLAVPPEVAAVFRSLATAEGTLSALAPGFDLVSETRHLAGAYLAEQLTPEQLRQTAVDELAALVPILRRLPRRVERIANAAEHGRLGLSVRLLADERDRAALTDMLHEVILAFLAATIGIMAVLLLGTAGGPVVNEAVSLYDLIGYNLLVISGILALRVLMRIFRRAG